MGRQLTPAEREEARGMAVQRFSPVDIHKKLRAKRIKRGMEAPDLTTVRRCLKRQTHRVDKVETRGRKLAFTSRNVLSLSPSCPQELLLG